MEAIMVSIDGEQFPDSAQAEELLDILENPMAHIDIQFEVERMGCFAAERKWKRSNCPYFEETVLENNFRTSWSEKLSKVVEREGFLPANVWLDGYDARCLDYHLAEYATKT
jgi:hypothetical protein